MRRTSRRTLMLGAASATIVMAAYGLAQPTTQPSDAANGARAVAVIHATDGNSAHGLITFTQQEGGIRVVADMQGLSAGEHGFHIHQWGDCSAPNGTSAGGHFNPHGVDHAGAGADTRHVGDLGNITADESGAAHYDRLDGTLAFEGDNNIIGRGVIVHADVDDLTSQPTGAAGARIACGVIGMASPPTE